MSAFHCPMCGQHMIRTGKIPISFARLPGRESLALSCSYCSCAIEVEPDTGRLFDFQGLRITHLKQPWPGLRFLNYTAITPRGVSVLVQGES